MTALIKSSGEGAQTGGGVGAVTPRAAQRSLANAPLLIGLAFVSTACLYRLLSFKVPVFDGDEFAFALVARDVLFGKLPNSGVFDNKPVGLTYLFALTEWLGGQTVASLRTLGFIAWAASGAFIYRSARQLQLQRGGALLITSLFMLGALCIGAFATMSELLACPFLAAANLVLIGRDRRPPSLLAAGAALGLACQVTYLAAPSVAFTVFGVLMLDPGRTFRARMIACVLLSSSCILAAVVVWGPQVLVGNWTVYMASQFHYHQSYRLASFHWDDWLLGFVLPLAGLSFPLMLLFLVRLRSGSGGGAPFSLFWIFVLQFAGAALAATVSNRFYPHYLLLALPASAAMAALLLSQTPADRRVLGWVVLLTSLTVAALIPLDVIRARLRDPGIEVRAAAVVDRLTTPKDRLLVFNEAPTIYYLAHRFTEGRYIFPSHYLSTCNHVATVADPSAVLLQALARRPALVLLGAMCPPQINDEQMIRNAGYHLIYAIQTGDRRLSFYAPLEREEADLRLLKTRF